MISHMILLELVAVGVGRYLTYRFGLRKKKKKKTLFEKMHENTIHTV